MPTQVKLTTGRLYWLPAGSVDGYVDFGNVADYKDAPKLKRVEHVACNDGLRKTDVALIATEGVLKTFTLDEEFAAILLLLALGTQQANLIQDTAVGADSTLISSDTVTITADGGGEIFTAEINLPITGRVYAFGAQGLSILTAGDANNVALVSGAAYSLDYGSGMLTVLQAAPAGPWTITFTRIAVTDLVFSSLDNLFTAGTFRLFEFDQYDPVPYATETFTGQCYITAWGDNPGDKFTEYTLEVLITP